MSIETELAIMSQEIQAEEDRRIFASIEAVTFVSVSLVAHPTDPLCVFPHFTVIAFKTNKEQIFIYHKGESPFTIYGVKGIRPEKCEYLLK